MEQFKDGIDALKTPPATKLTILGVVLTIVIGVILMVGSYVIVVANEVLMLEGNLSALPALMDEQTEEVERQYDVYTGDYIVRGDLAVLLYNEYEGSDMAERLELTRDNLDAMNVTVLNDKGELVASTRIGGLSSVVNGAFDAMKDSKTPLFDPNMGGLIDKEMLEGDGYDPETDSLPMVYCARTADGNILVVEFDYTSFGKVYASRVSVDEVCKRVLAGIDGYAFIRTEDGAIASYASTEIAEDKKDQLNEEAKTIFSRRGMNFNMEFNDRYRTSYLTATLLGELHLVVKLDSPDVQYDFMVAVPASSFIDSMLVCNIAIIALAVLGFALFASYATILFRQNPVTQENKRLYGKEARRRTLQGALVVVVVTVVLAGILLALEAM